MTFGWGGFIQKSKAKENDPLYGQRVQLDFCFGLLDIQTRQDAVTQFEKLFTAPTVPDVPIPSKLSLFILDYARNVPLTDRNYWNW